MSSPAGSLNGLSEPGVAGGSPPKPPNRRRVLKAKPTMFMDRRATLSSWSSRPVAIRFWLGALAWSGAEGGEKWAGVVTTRAAGLAGVVPVVVVQYALQR